LVIVWSHLKGLHKDGKRKDTIGIRKQDKKFTETSRSGSKKGHTNERGD